MELDIANEPVAGGIAVHVRVRLSGREASRLFLSGDTLVALPLEGCVGDANDGSPIPRSAIFLSELAGLADGFTRVFVDDASAERFATVVRTDLQQALEAS